jgi:hypothetical protein
MRKYEYNMCTVWKKPCTYTFRPAVIFPKCLRIRALVWARILKHSMVAEKITFCLQNKCCIIRKNLNNYIETLHSHFQPSFISKSFSGLRAQILKHLLEAEQSTLQGELSFQRSECTAGLTVASFFVLVLKTILSKQLRKD